MAGIIGGWSLGQASPSCTRPPLPLPHCHIATPAQVRGDIELENIDFCYPARPDKRIFDGFSLTIPAGREGRPYRRCWCAAGRQAGGH